MARASRLVSWRRGFRTAPLWLAAATLGLSGCLATKGDIETLQFDLAHMQARQDSLYRDLLRQDRILLDSLRRSAQSTRDVMADLGHRITQITNDMKALQGLIGQTQQQLIEQRAQFERLQQERLAPAPAATTPSSNNPEELYMIGMTKFNDGSYSTARLAYEELLRAFPEHPRAVDARFYLGETYAAEEDFDRAMLEMERVVEMHPNHARARQALFRAGQFAEQKRDRTKALSYYRLLMSRYPTSDEAKQADVRIKALNR